MATPDEIEDEVLNTLPTLGVTELEEIYPLINFDCNEAWKGNRMILLKNLLKHICGLANEGDDGGLSIMLVIQQQAYSKKLLPKVVKFEKK